jgi:hypothetical protein
VRGAALLRDVDFVVVERLFALPAARRGLAVVAVSDIV